MTFFLLFCPLLYMFKISHKIVKNTFKNANINNIEIISFVTKHRVKKLDF